MTVNQELPDYPIGRYIAKLRESAGMTQAQLSKMVTVSSATLSRIESGEKSATSDEIAALLEAIGPAAAGLEEFLGQVWDQIERPLFDHPNRLPLWQANLALRKLAELRSDPDLKGVLLRQIDLYEAEIRRLADFLVSRDHQIAFIGSIGVGKSTGICKLTGLLKPGEEKLDKQIVLETGAGGITLCEVHISSGPKYGLRIVPRTEDSIRRDVEDWCTYLISTVQTSNPSSSSNEEEEADPLGLSKEVVRAIRNMSGLTEKRREEGGKRVRIDPAKELALQYGNAQELCIHVLTRMNLLRRNQRDAWYPDDYPQSPMHWLQHVFSEVNNGRNSEFTLPQKIEVIVPGPVFESQELPLRIIDTKGIDQTAERQDLECHFDDPRTLVVLCSHFNNAPQVELQTLLRRAKESGVREIAPKTMLLVLPRPEEAMAEKYDDGAKVEDDSEGYDLKRDKIELRLNQQGFSGVEVEFFNAREEAPIALRDRLVSKIVEYRNQFCAQVEHMSNSVDRLIENREDEAIRLAFEEVARHLETWIEKHRTLDLSEDGVQDSLVTAIDGTRYASTVRAAVRRNGDWANLDYYHHLGFGVRRLAVSQIGQRIDTFKVILGNLVNNEHLSAAKEFLQNVLVRIDVEVDEAYRRLQVAGREVFEQVLKQDHEFWGRCEQRWGQGQGYRSAIRNMTDQQFEENYESAQAFVLKLMSDEWEQIVATLEGMLQEKSEPSVAEVNSAS